jgi:DNA repair exonuclease SbcCD ATPase subunit
MNEAGKSTLQQAVRALLYGFYAGDRARPEESARHERFRPWDGGVYRGSLEYEKSDGSRFEIRRDFSTPDVSTQLIDLFSGEDISSQFGRGRHGNVPFARRHLGMSAAVFQSCAFISQGEIFHVAENGPKEIADAIAALADTAGRDVSATKAIERLKAALTRVGSDRARTAELPRAREELARAEAELKAIDSARESLSGRAAGLDRLQEELGGLDDEIERTGRAFAQSRARELSGRLRKLDEATELKREADVVTAEVAAFAKFPAELRDEVLSLKVRWEQAVESLAVTRQECASAESEISADERLEVEALRVVVGSLSAEQVSFLEAIAYGTERAWPVRLILAAGRAIARAARAAWRFIRRRPAESERAPATSQVAVSRDEALALLEKHRLYLTLAPAINRLRELRRKLEAEEAREATAESRMLTALQSAGVSCQRGVQEAVGTFLERCRLRDRYEKAVSSAEEAAKRMELLLSGTTRDQIEAEQSECERRLSRSGRQERVRVQESSRELARKHRQLQGRRSELEVRIARLREEVRLTMSQHRSRAEVEEEAALARVRVSELERTRAALRKAVEAIEEAMVSVYRDFAPAVNTFLSDGIEQVTDGRYSRAHVDPKTLEISLLLPETGLVVKDAPVSHGTRTLAYVLMRIGLAQHMSSVGEAVPLVLDDPFVDIDSARLPRILDYLADLSGEIQVLFFTKDWEIVNWVEGREAEGWHRVHEILPAVRVTT